jgi:hypothetical protein
VFSNDGKAIAPSHGYPGVSASGAGEAHPVICPRLWGILSTPPRRPEPRQDEHLPPRYIGPSKRRGGAAGLVPFGLQDVCSVGEHIGALPLDPATTVMR